MASVASLAILALLCGAWVMIRLLSREETPELRQVEWLLPLRGRWLRYALAGVLVLSLVLCFRQLARRPTPGLGAPRTLAAAL